MTTQNQNPQQSQITTQDLMLMVLYVQIHKAGGALTITQAEYTEAMAAPH